MSDFALPEDTLIFGERENSLKPDMFEYPYEWIYSLFYNFI